MAKARQLHVVEAETGELEDLCQNPACIELREELRGEKTEKRSWRSKYYRAVEDKEAEARAHPLWPQAFRLFEWWKFVTGHKKSRWTHDRFWTVERFLRDEGYADCVKAIQGLMASDFHMKRGKHANRDGSKFDEFERVFETQGDFEKWRDAIPSASPETVEFFEWFDRLPG